MRHRSKLVTLLAFAGAAAIAGVAMVAFAQTSACPTCASNNVPPAAIVIPGVGAVGAASPFPATGVTNVPTYSAADLGIANTGAGDIFCVKGSATKTVYIKKFRASGIATSASIVDTGVIKRSTPDTGGTPVAETLVPNDSQNAAATATVTAYTVSPTAGTAVGFMRARHVAIGVQGNSATTSDVLFDFAAYWDQPLVLRGVNESACINVGAVGTGGSWAADVELTEGPPP